MIASARLDLEQLARKRNELVTNSGVRIREPQFARALVRILETTFGDEVSNPPPERRRRALRDGYLDDVAPWLDGVARKHVLDDLPLDVRPSGDRCGGLSTLVRIDDVLSKRC